MNASQLALLQNQYYRQLMGGAAGVLPSNLLGNRMAGGMHPVYNDDGSLQKPYRRNATHVAIAYYIQTDKMNQR